MIVIKGSKKTGTQAAAGVTQTLSQSGKVIAETATDLTQDAKKLGPSPKQVAESTVPWGAVGVGTGFTKNLGNFQSARVEVWINIPSTPSEFDKVFDVAENFCNEKLKQMIAEIGGPDPAV